MAEFRGEDENTYDHETVSHEERQSRDNNKTFRFMMLGRDDALMNKACAAILGLPQRENDRNIGTCVVKEDEISGRRISVLKTPSYWLEHLKSNMFFSNGVKSIRNEMEFCESQLFPGPHAFLLVLGDVQNSDKEHLLLQALSDVYGEDALDYTMVLLMRNDGRRDILKNRCVKRCRERYYVLEDNEDSVLNLLEDIEAMTQWKQNSYFTKHFELLERAKKYFQKECETCEQWKGELERMKLTVKEKSNEITELQKKHSDDLHKVIYEFKVSENQLRKDLNQLGKDLDDSKVRENQLRKDLDDSKVRENQLRKDLDDSNVRENQLRKDLDDLKVRDNYLRKDLDDLKVRENQFRNYLDYSNFRENQLRKDLDDSKVRENQLRKDLDDSKVRENQLKADNKKLKREIESLKEKEMCERQRDVDKRKIELETREKESAPSSESEPDRYSSTAVPPPADKTRPADEGDRAEGRDEASQASGSDVTVGLKLVRRHSLPYDPPNMSESEHGPLHNLKKNLSTEDKFSFYLEAL
nr:M protein, serotype 2.1-like [Misgurnus anguillicaudatus]